MLLASCDGSPSELEITSLPNRVFTVAVLPDTQGYSQSYPEIFTSQTSWLAEQAQDLGLKMVIHVGDIVEASWGIKEWENAQRAMSLLDGVVPYSIAPGNHDYGITEEESNSITRTTYYHKYFPRSLYEAMPGFGGFESVEYESHNTFHTFESDGQQWIVIALQFAPPDPVVAWADRVLTDHPDHLAIIATHAYLYFDDTRYAWSIYGAEQHWSPYAYGVGKGPRGSVNDGQELWDKLIARHDNVVAVVCGHVLDDGLGYAVSQGAGEVHEILANYQMKPKAGEGYLRLMYFNTTTGHVEVRTYSPWLDAYKTDPANLFSFDYSSHLAR